MSKPISGVVPVILAGGKSSRMGQDKAFVRLGNQPMIEVILAKLSPLFCLSPIIIANQPEKYTDLGVQVQADKLPSLGPLSGIHAALHYASAPFIFVVGCDNPLLNAGVIGYMQNQIADYDIVVPDYGGYYHPLHAIYKQHCLPVIEAMLRQDNRKLTDLFSKMKVRYIQPGELEAIPDAGKSFVNVNTPADVAKVQSFFNKFARG